jgi:hypothetical protein
MVGSVLQAPQQESTGSRAGEGTRRRERARIGRVGAARSVIASAIMWGQIPCIGLTEVPPVLIHVRVLALQARL